MVLVALQSGLGVKGAPRTTVAALTPRTLAGPSFPAHQRHGGLPRFRVEEMVQMRTHRQG